MRDVTNKKAAIRTHGTTGLTGEPLKFVINIATITAVLGKFPTKVDACYYLGMSEPEMNNLEKDAMYMAWADKYVSLKKWFNDAGIVAQPRLKAMTYAVATDLVLEGLLENEHDGDGRARNLLKAMFKPQQVSSRAEFDGFLITLEFLRHRDRSLDMPLSQFLKLRYGNFRKYDALGAFSEIVCNNDPESFPKSDYAFVVGRLAELIAVCD